MIDMYGTFLIKSVQSVETDYVHTHLLLSFLDKSLKCDALNVW